MIEAGAAGVHFEDQLASVKKCGHMGGKVLVPTREAVAKLVAARLAADVMGVPTVLLARTDAEAADLVTSDVDENDKPFLHRRAHGRRLLPARKPGLDQAISRGLAYARVRRPGLVRDRQARPRLRARPSPRRSTRSSRASCWPTTARRRFNWKKNLDDATIAKFQRELGAMGYKFQFITLAGFHSLNYSMFDLALRLRAQQHERLRRAAGGGVRRRREGLHRGQAPARGRHRLLRRGDARRSSAKRRPRRCKGSTEDEQFFDRQARLRAPQPPRSMRTAGCGRLFAEAAYGSNSAGRFERFDSTPWTSITRIRRVRIGAFHAAHALPHAELRLAVCVPLCRATVRTAFALRLRGRRPSAREPPGGRSPTSRRRSTCPMSCASSTTTQYRDIRFRPEKRVVARREAAVRADVLPSRASQSPSRCAINVDRRLRASGRLAFDPATVRLRQEQAIDPQTLARSRLQRLLASTTRSTSRNTRTRSSCSSARATSVRVGKGQRYGLSARGLAIDTAARPGRGVSALHVEFWIERPRRDAELADDLRAARLAARRRRLPLRA